MRGKGMGSRVLGLIKHGVDPRKEHVDRITPEKIVRKSAIEAIEIYKKLVNAYGGKEGANPMKARILEQLRVGIMRGEIKDWETLIQMYKQQGKEEFLNKMLTNRDLQAIDGLFLNRPMIQHIKQEREKGKKGLAA